jgi:pimeloyl-ACP methyl ester carboxylesterase
VTVPHIDVDGVRYAYTEQGSGPLVVFFHGTLSGKESFARTIQKLPSGYRYVAFDWPGHGESTYNPSGWSVEDLVDAVPALIAGLGETRAVLVGISQGGAIGLRVALRPPDVLAGLVTINAGADPVSPEAVARVGELGRALRDGTDSERRETAKLVVGLHHPPEWAESHRELIEQEIELILSHPREAAAHATQIPAQYESIENRLPEISCPTLVIWGERDPRQERGPRMVAAIPDSDLCVIPDAGHHAQVEAPGLVAEAVSDFLVRLELSDAA